MNHIWEGASIETHGKGSSNDADGVLSPLGTVALPPLQLDKMRCGAMRNVSRPEAEMLNEWLGPIFMSERRMSVKFAVAAVLVLHLPFGAERSANSIALMATEHYLPNHIDLSPSSAGSILKILARHGLVSFRNNRNGRVWWRAV